PPPVPRCCSGARRRKAAAWTLARRACACGTAIPARARRAPSALLRSAAALLWAITLSFSPGRASGLRFRTRPKTAPSSRAAPSRRRCGRVTGSPGSTPCSTCSASPDFQQQQGDTMSGTLILVRHGQSEWNLKNLFTGWRDVGLSERGHEEARAAGQRIKAKGRKPDIAFTSALKRAQVTSDHILDVLGLTGLQTIRDQALNERDYGDLSGLNKDDARKKWGEEQVHIWRRSYDVQPPGGESLKDTGARV